MLVKELEELGAADIRLDDAGCVYATIPANCDVKAPVVGFIAHMDTTPRCFRHQCHSPHNREL